MGGVQHAVQLWINLPRKDKMTTPRYQALTRESIPEVPFDGGKVRVIAGCVKITDTRWQILEQKWIAKTFSPVELYDVRFDRSWKLDLTFPEGYTTLALVTEWNMSVNEKSLENGDMVHLSRDGNEMIIESDFLGKILIMAWAPLEEPVVAYGPFVMSTQEEIMQAFTDLNAGKMG